MILTQRRQLASFLGCIVLVFSLAQPTSFAQRRRAAGPPSTRPQVKLVVGLMIDQFRADYLVRFRDQFVAGGFQRLLKGAVFANANYLHTPTFTACGHATFMTGATPSMNGIIGNEWLDRGSGSRVTSVSDSTVKLLGGEANALGASPGRLFGSTVGDELKLATNGESKVIGIAFKDRSAILPAGKKPNGAFWFDNKTGAFVSSSFYFNDLPEWVKKFNREVPPARYFGAKWQRLLPEGAYRRSRPDKSAEETSRYGNTFPYTITGGDAVPGPKFYAQFELTPLANEYAFEFVKTAIENESLGADFVPDLLTISLSPNDLLGHSYGPYSQEVQDMALRTDRMLADFFSYLDRRIGLGNVVIVLCADHGVAPIPEQVREMGFGGRIDPKAISAAIQTALTTEFGQAEWVSLVVNGNAYLDQSIIDQRKLDRRQVERATCASILKIPGVGGCFTQSDILEGTLPRDRIAASVARGFHPKRNGNVVIVPEPFYFIAEGINTTHGTPYTYDTHVPLIFFGVGIVPGYHTRECSPIDIAPTLAALLGLTAPSNSEGSVLVEALAKPR